MSDLDFTNKLFVEYLQRRLDRTAVPGHWLSTGSLFAKGDRHYGILKLDGKRYYAHRAIWEWKTGKEPLGLIRLTSECKYELCVRPEHLWEVADAETATEPALPKANVRREWPLQQGQVPLLLRWGLTERATIEGVTYFQRNGKYYAKEA